ncbi:MAG: glycosyltransferase family protein [Oscillospiraceae bacterium]|jgi:spore coat polysaccharide biosynthesis protein SpsF|nr:glycosyltransferase family protein [Oscillospiraceae bacterium]
MNIIALIQARYDSTRFPNKVITDIEGKPEIIRVINRVQKSKCIDDIVVVTSIEKSNLSIVKICAENSIRVFVGSENDVLDRYYQCAKLLKTDYIVRITADCPVLDWRYLDEAVKIVRNNPGIDYLSDLDETFPDGLDIEIIKFSKLAEMWEKAKLSSEREHVTMYIKNNKNNYNIYNYPCPIKDISHHRWTFDEKEDYELIKNIYVFFNSIDKENFVTEDILTYLERNPEVMQINSMYSRNMGLQKSLKEDKIMI